MYLKQARSVYVLNTSLVRHNCQIGTSQFDCSDIQTGKEAIMTMANINVYAYSQTKSVNSISLSCGVFSLIVILSISILPLQALAQQVHFKVGSRVKIDAPALSASDFIGKISAFSDSSMVLEVGEYTYIIPVSEIREMSISTGITTHVKEGLTFGALAGVLTGGFIGYFSYKPCIEESTYSCLFRPQSRTGATVLGSILGLVPGALLGRLIGTYDSENWEKLPNQMYMHMKPVGNLQAETYPQLTLRWKIGAR